MPGRDEESREGGLENQLQRDAVQNKPKGQEDTYLGPSEEPYGVERKNERVSYLSQLLASLRYNGHIPRSMRTIRKTKWS